MGNHFLRRLSFTCGKCGGTGSKYTPIFIRENVNKSNFFRAAILSQIFPKKCFSPKLLCIHLKIDFTAFIIDNKLPIREIVNFPQNQFYTN